MISYTYDSNSRRYRASNGRYISAQEVRKAVDELLAAETATMRAYAQDLLDGKINFAEWQLRSLTTIKQLHLATALAGNGGRNNTTVNDYSHVGTLLKKQYEYFRGMVADIRTGKQLLNGTLLSRVSLYAQAARGTHEEMKSRAAAKSGATECRNVLGVADHCHGASNGCIEQSARGWVKIGDLVPIGQRLCLANCKCQIVYK